MTLPTSLLFLYEAHQVVVVGRPLTCHTDEQRIHEILPVVQAYLDRNPVRAGVEEWKLSISSGLVEGGSAFCHGNIVELMVMMQHCVAPILLALSLSSSIGLIVVVVGGAIHGIAGSSGPHGGDHTPLVDIGTDEAEQGTHFAVCNAHELAIMVTHREEFLEALAYLPELLEVVNFDLPDDPSHWDLDPWDIDFFLNPSPTNADRDTAYDDMESDYVDAARDRRISLLATQMQMVSLGYSMEEECAEQCEGIAFDRDAVLANPKELARLLDLYYGDPRPVAPRFAPRDTSSHMSRHEQYKRDEDLDFLRFCLIAYKPGLLGWHQNARSPLTEDDWYHTPSPELDATSPTWHVWNNPQQLLRMERGYVQQWMLDRQLRLQQLAQAEAPREVVGPVPDAAAAAYGPVHELRAGLRALAAPLPAYELRREADMIGDDLYAGGGKGDLAAPSGPPVVFFPEGRTQSFYIGTPGDSSYSCMNQWSCNEHIAGTLSNPGALDQMIKDYDREVFPGRDGDGYDPVPIHLSVDAMDVPFCCYAVAEVAQRAHYLSCQAEMVATG
eukprot:4252062-Amphidinium_carterae.2